MVEPLGDGFGVLVSSTSCIQLIVGFRSSFIFDSNTADERLLLKTCVQPLKFANYMIGAFVYMYVAMSLSHTSNWSLCYFSDSCNYLQ